MNKKKWLCILLCTVLGITALLGGFQTFGKTKVENVKRPVVVLDPGHGGTEGGAWATHGGITYKEEEINWKISNYTMQELQKDGSVEVHLTKTYNQRMGLKERVEKAKKLEADLLVSQHINYSSSPSVRGASVLISKGTYRPYLAKEEKKFGKYVMEELGKLGIHRRYPETGGMEYRMSANNSRYPNGALRDYYGIVASSVEMDIPGVIVEHAFISSPQDAKEFLGSDAKLRRVAKADAKAIIRYCKTLPKKEVPSSRPEQKPVKKNGWSKENGHVYYYKDGKKVKNKLIKMENGDVYYVDKNGIRFNKGFRTIKSGEKAYTYFFNSNGKAQKKWMKLNQNWYYFTSKAGVMLQNTQVKSSSGKVYKFDSKGVCINRK